MGKKAKAKETPLMQQYYKIKGKYPDALLLFRVGDFYETFGEDAIKTANILGITLTQRHNGSASEIELAGFPHHAIDTYLPKLVRAGQRVAVCDQLEDPKLTKTIVKRGVTELVTPGVVYNDNVLSQKSNNYLAAIHYDKQISGIAFIDISTGEFLVSEGNNDYIDKLLAGFQPSEIIIQRSKKQQFVADFSEKYYLSLLEDWAFNTDFANELLTNHFETASLKGFGIDRYNHAVIAAGAALHYIRDTQHEKLAHINTISRINQEKHVWLDRFTIQNLELFSSINENAQTLISVLDQTITPMGSRMLKRWVSLPLKEIVEIKKRQGIVVYFVQNIDVKDTLQHYLKQVGDIERLISKVAAGRINPREVIQIKKALIATEPVKDILLKSNAEELHQIGEQLNLCKTIRNKIQETIIDEPAINVAKGGVIAQNVCKELDELREIRFSSKEFLQKMKDDEIQKTGISSLKIGFNNVFGYYLEVRNTHKDKVPENWIRKQTLTNAERYITEELKEYEEKIITAEDKILVLEQEIYEKILHDLSQYIQPIQLNAAILAKIDCLVSFANISIINNYNKPELTEEFSLSIQQGRHPVIEKTLPPDKPYIANDVRLDTEKQQIIIITGPNMSGKSALLRQTALIVIMAQIGSFVPADSASIGLVDKIFTRVGASDNISSGESTFMVEMNETASILNNLSARSLVLLDEIGRGTSTYDGISIAWAISEYIHNHPTCRAKTLFATHYHELNEMAKTHKRIKNYNVAVKEHKGKVLFLRKLVKGGSEHSFGIYVAKMAGIPKSVTERASVILSQLEGETNQAKNSMAKPLDTITSQKAGYQLSFFQLDDPVLEQIREKIVETDINTLTPVEALLKLNDIKKLIGG